MSVAYLKTILEESKNVVCLLGRSLASNYGCDFYNDMYGDEIELKYGYSLEEIFSSVYFNNRPASFYEFYREELLKKRGAPTECDYALRRMEEDGKLLGIVTSGTPITVWMTMSAPAAAFIMMPSISWTIRRFLIAGNVALCCIQEWLCGARSWIIR